MRIPTWKSSYILKKKLFKMEENYNKEKIQRKNDSKVIKKRPLLHKLYFSPTFHYKRGTRAFDPK